jgi:uncharacterized membrane protein YkoI
MKTTKLICPVLAAGLLAGCVSEKDEHQEVTQAQLMAQAKVGKAYAEQIALAKVPNGTAREGELEKEHGKLIWSFDITTPDSKDITEVEVDAITGSVLAVDKETPEDQAKEAAGDAVKAKKDADQD